MHSALAKREGFVASNQMPMRSDGNGCMTARASSNKTRQDLAERNVKRQTLLECNPEKKRKSMDSVDMALDESTPHQSTPHLATNNLNCLQPRSRACTLANWARAMASNPKNNDAKSNHRILKLRIGPSNWPSKESCCV